MNYIKIISKFIILLLIGIIILSSLYYFDIINNSLYKIIKISFLIIMFSINGYSLLKISKGNNKNILFLIILISLLLVLNLIFNKLSYNLFIYLLIIVFSYILGCFIYKKKYIKK